MSHRNTRGPGRFDRVLCICLFLLAAASASAEEVAAPREDSHPGVVPAPELVGPVWPSPAPEQDAVWDWVQTTSGEWLKGRIKDMRDTVLQFDSDEFDLQEIDWEDVKQVRSARKMTVMYDEFSVDTGYLSTEGNSLIVETSERRVRIPFVNVVSLGVGTANEKDYWSADVALSANLRSGNSDQADLNAMAEINRRTVRSNFRADYRGNYSRQGGTESTNDHRLNVTSDRLLSRHWFVRPLALEFFRDEFQNTAEQWTLGVGGGYFIEDNAITRWSVYGGPAYLRTRFVTVPPGEPLVEDTPALGLGTEYEREVTASVDVQASYDLTVVNEDAGRALHSFLAAIDIDLTKLLDLRVALTIDRTENPQVDALGAEPEKNDTRLTIGFDYEL